MADKNKQIRILADTSINNVLVPAGRVATLPPQEADQYVKQQVADDSKDAVDYALSVNSLVIDPYATAE
jgi:hypothetical protein